MVEHRSRGKLGVTAERNWFASSRWRADSAASIHDQSHRPVHVPVTCVVPVPQLGYVKREPIENLYYPAETAIWIVDQEMTFFEAVRRLSATERFLLAWGMVPLGGIPEYCDEALSDAIEYLNKSGGASDVKVQLLGTRVILRAETASFSRAEDDLGALMLTPAATNFVHAACALYSTNRAALNPNRPDNPFGIVEHGWARWRIESRWLRLNGDVSRAEWIERWQETQSQRKKWRYLVVFGVGALLQLAGLCVLAGFAIPRWRGMPQTVPLPLFEEMLFRGVLFVALRRRLSLVWAAAASGVVFGAIHFYALPGFAAVSAFGFLNAIAYEKTGSLAPCVAAHMLTNLLLVGGTSWIYS